MDVTWPQRKNMANARARGCIIRAELIEPGNVPRWEIDDKIRRRTRESGEEELGRRREENCLEYHRLRMRVKLSGRETEFDKQREVG